MVRLKLCQEIIKRKYKSMVDMGSDMSEYIFIPVFRRKKKKAPDPDRVIIELREKQKELEEKYYSYRDLLKVTSDSIPQHIDNQNSRFILERKKELLTPQTGIQNVEIESKQVKYMEMESVFKTPTECLAKVNVDEVVQISAELKKSLEEKNGRNTEFNGIFEEKMVTDPIFIGDKYLEYEQLSLLLFTLSQSIERGEFAISKKIASLVMKHNSLTYHRYLLRLTLCKLNNINITI